jgi:hypothetical protein
MPLSTILKRVSPTKSSKPVLAGGSIAASAGLPAKIFVPVNRFATSFLDGELGVAVNRQVDRNCSAQCVAVEGYCRLLWSAVTA